MRINSAAKTNIGKIRKINQDAFISDDDLGFYVVADGMGGHAAGEVAAQEAVEATHDMIIRNKALIEDFSTSPITRELSNAVRRLMESAVQSATYLVFGIAEQKPNYSGMGTTMSALLIAGAHGVTAQVGDSRIYRIHDGEAVQLTEDHTLVNWQLREGLITPEEAQYSPHKNIITRAVGNKDYVQVDTQIIPVSTGDYFLICSDGLHGYLRNQEIPDILEKTPKEACDILVDLANERGGKDNITVIALEILD